MASGLATLELRANGAALNVSNTSVPILITIPHASRAAAEARLLAVVQAANTSALNVTLNVTCTLHLVGFGIGAHQLSAAACVFFDTRTQQWSGDGCWVYNATDTYTVCACSHLTDFAIFLPPTNVRYFFAPPPAVSATNELVLVFTACVLAVYIALMVVVTRARCCAGWAVFVAWLRGTRLCSPDPHPGATTRVRFFPSTLCGVIHCM